MVPSRNECIDVASLLCSEDVSGCLSEDDNVFCEDRQEAYSLEECQAAGIFIQRSEELLDAEECISVLSERESCFMPAPDYILKFGTRLLDAGARREAVHWILKVRSLYGFAPLTVALSINYLDRFLSLYHFPSNKAWMMQLLSITCLSMAAKLEETDVPFLLDLQVEADYLFEPRVVQRMELLLGSTLGWRMSSVTPFSYTAYLIRRLDLCLGFKRVLYCRVEELVLCALQELVLVEFRPSAIAAGATLYCIKKLWPEELDSHKQKLLSIMPLHLREPSEKCFEAMGKLRLLWCRISRKCCIPQSPAGVLDASFSSNSNNDSDRMVEFAGSDASASSPQCKRIKLEQHSHITPL